MNKQELIGKQFGKWLVIGDTNNKIKVRCRCLCEHQTEKDINIYHLTAGRSTCCGKPGCKNVYRSTVNGESWAGKQFYEFTVLEEIGGGKVRAQCSCKGPDSIKELYKYLLKDGKSKSCGCKASYYKSQATLNDITGKKFNRWTVLKELGKGMVKVQCECGNIRTIQKASVLNGTSKSCGHATNMFQDLTGKTFFNWTVEKELGHGKVLCRCKCGNTNIVSKVPLQKGQTKSCGCLKTQVMQESLLEKYGDITANRASNPREPWQIEVLSTRENLLKYITDNFNDTKPTIRQLVKLLNTGESWIGRKIILFGLQDYICYSSSSSSYEDEIVDYIKNIYSGTIERNTRQVIPPSEIDIYLPDLRLAIEFNGNYWHNSLQVPYRYHQNKTLNCLAKNIRLIHIFEYEWDNIQTKEKLKAYLRSIILNDNLKIYARDTEVIADLDIDTVRNFLETHHLQGFTQYSQSVGLQYNGELIALMTFGTPRFDTNSECELLRLCTKTGYKIVGGASKILSHFLEINSKITNIISYCNISKFTGEVYKSLGFKKDTITKPNYVWVSLDDTHNVFSRYQTQKQKLIEMGLGKQEQTEQEIMLSLGCIQMYDSGNVKYILNKEER